MRTRPVSPAVLAAVLVGAACGVYDGHTPTVDIPYFVQRGDVLLSSAWSSTFSMPDLQAGPVQIGALAAVAKLGGLPLVALLLDAGLAGLLAWTAGRALADRPARARAAAQIGVVVAAAAHGTFHHAYTDGHPAQIATPLLWIAAALLARRGRTGRAGLLVGLSACLETWGILGLPVLLLAGRRDALRGLAAAVGAAALAYGPFLLFGRFRMLDYSWPVVAGSPANLFLAAGSTYTWWLRALQGAAALGVGSLLALRLPRANATVWIVPFAVVVTRLAFEPTLNDWYLIAVQTTALVAAADLCSCRLSPFRRRAAVVVT